LAINILAFPNEPPPYVQMEAHLIEIGGVKKRASIISCRYLKMQSGSITL